MASFSLRTLFSAIGAGALLAAGMSFGATPANAAGLVWVSQSSPSDNSWRDVAFGNGTFVAVSSTTGSGKDQVMTSTDGVTWTPRAASVDNGWQSVAYGNGTFMAVSSQGSAMTSPDGISWTSAASTGFDTRALAFGNGVFVAIGIQSPYAKTSSDNGASWSSATGAHKAQYYGATFGNNLFVAVGSPVSSVADAIYSNADGSKWISSDHVNGVGGVPHHQWNDVTYGAGIFVAVDQRGAGFLVMTSTDGMSWTPRVTTGDHRWEGIVYAEGIFVAVADRADSSPANERIMTSTDGIAWTLQDAPTAGEWQSITYGNGLFVAVGNTGAIMTSGASSGGGAGSGGSGGSGSTGTDSTLRVPDVTQQYAISTEMALTSPQTACVANAPAYVVDGRVNAQRQFEGWELSYAAWPDSGSGGYVCTRTLSYQEETDIWLTSGSMITGSGQLQQYAIQAGAVARMVDTEEMSPTSARIEYCKTGAPNATDLGKDWGQRNEGWSPSYAMWVDGGVGEWVCTRTL